MRLYLDDRHLTDRFYPLTVTNKFEDLSIGLFSFSERWRKLAEKQGFSLELVEDSTIADCIIPANLIPTASLDLFAFFQEKQPDIRGFLSPNRIWELVSCNADMITSDVAILDDFAFLKENKAINHTGSHDMLIHETAIVEHCFFNTNDGPIIIDEHAHIMCGAMLRGPIYIGKYSIVKMGAQLYGGTNIGNNCTVGGEIKNAIFLDFSNKSHHGYIGDSYIGKWCNLGAGTTGSNLKNTVGDVRVWDHSTAQYIHASNKAGVFMGDHVKTAINTSFNSGTIVSPFSNIFSNTLYIAPKFVPMFAWGLESNEHYRLDDLIKEIDRWMKMKKQSLTETEKEKIIQLYKTYIK
jgi:UDP-N-acetylglucosamine diphosphorylase/glucosamine-1-phosphate N-acetyltransferase